MVQYLQSSFRPLIVKMMVIVIFYCQNLMRQVAIINYWLKFFTLKNTAKKRVILDRMLGN